MTQEIAKSHLPGRPGDNDGRGTSDTEVLGVGGLF
jgi:hypothetical protein